MARTYRRRELEPPGALKPAVQVHERDARLGRRGPAGFDDIGDGLLGGFVGADILSGGAETAVERRRVVPERTLRVDVDAEIGALELADSVHRHIPRRQPRVPAGLRRQLHGVRIRGALVDDGVATFGSASQPVWRALREALDDGDVDPDVLPDFRSRGQDDLEAGSQARARPRDAPRALERDVGRHAQAAAEEVDLELTRVQSGSHGTSKYPSRRGSLT